MNLLKRNKNNGTISLVDAAEREDEPYAILSHRWGKDEVAYQDLTGPNPRSARDKLGYRKIEFCVEQAWKDGISFCWIDTCCIDKKNAVQLQTAINSMFSWYSSAKKCYALLVDVPPSTPWLPSFRASAWFTRGWTLQELLAPKTVEFFSENRERLGDRVSLEQHIHEVTRIPLHALRGTPLKGFSIDERVLWMDNRETTEPEDKAYALFGILDVCIPLLYGEGYPRALRRLMEVAGSEINQWQQQPPGPPHDKAANLRAEKEDCLRSLGFATLNSRKRDIENALPNTCDWLFDTNEFQEWNNRAYLTAHNGVLWIKGKPGAGKSTLMKHALRYCERTFKDHQVVAYFFNARGHVLEKTAIGMLRSIVRQLVETDDVFYQLFIPLFREKSAYYGQDGRWEWGQEELKDFLVSLVQRRLPRPLLLLVDALDECSEPEIRRVVSFLEDLSIHATAAPTALRTCLSSRHYPLVSMCKNLELTVEGTRGHCRDIATYIAKRLVVRDDKIEADIQQRANGVFLWVVIVVELLNRAYDEGDVQAMRTVLEEVPDDLEKVFEKLLNQGKTHQVETTLLLLQWVLLAERPLQLEELLSVVLAGTGPGPGRMASWDRRMHTDDTMRRRITNLSKGLVELREGDRNCRGASVQFIHLSVNDFLLRNHRLQKLDATLEPDPVSASHGRLWSCCRRSIEYIDTAQMQIPASKYVTRDLFQDFPFLGYAAEHIFDHAEKALEGEVEREAIIAWLQRCKNWFTWWKRVVVAERWRRFFHEEDINTGLLYILSFCRFYRLVCVVTEEIGFTDINAEAGYFGTALQAASAKGYTEIVRLLLDRGANINAEAGYFGTALQAASANGYTEIARLLLDRGANINAEAGLFGTALQAASANEHTKIARLFLDRGANINAEAGYYGTALQAASANGYTEIVQLFLDRGANIHAEAGHYGTALQAAWYHGHTDIAQLLFDRGANLLNW